MRYYCHHCHTQIDADELLPEFTCPSCHSGFVEELPPTAARHQSNLDESNRPGSDDGLPGFISPRMSNSDDYSDDNSDVEFLEAVNGPVAQLFGLLQPPQQSTPNSGNPQESNTNTAIQQPQRMLTRSANRQLGRNTTPLAATYIDAANQNQSLADVLEDFITGVSFSTHYPEGTPSNSQGTQGASGSGSGAARGLVNIDFPLPFFHLHSNPADYAWGNAGFDAVITQLLNNLDGSNSGPPPMPKEQVVKLPTVKISDDQVKSNNLQCTVCMDDFQVGDSARQLQCEHFFHEDCILPWLELHASCPICRKTFVSGSNTTQNISPDTSTATSNASTDVNSVPNVHETARRGTNRSASSSTPLTNQNVTPNYDYTEDDCD